ncbi:hypothetical protein [Roseinatronobacter sp.]
MIKPASAQYQNTPPWKERYEQYFWCHYSDFCPSIIGLCANPARKRIVIRIEIQQQPSGHTGRFHTPVSAAFVSVDLHGVWRGLGWDLRAQLTPRLEQLHTLVR